MAGFFSSAWNWKNQWWKNIPKWWECVLNWQEQVLQSGKWNSDHFPVGGKTYCALIAAHSNDVKITRHKENATELGIVNTKSSSPSLHNKMELKPWKWKPMWGLKLMVFDSPKVLAWAKTGRGGWVKTNLRCNGCFLLLDNDDQADHKQNESWGWHNLGTKSLSEQGRKCEV